MKIARIIAGILAIPTITLMALLVFWPDVLRHDHSSSWAFYEVLYTCPGIPILVINGLLWLNPQFVKDFFDFKKPL